MKKSKTILNFTIFLVFLVTLSILLWKPLTALATNPQAIKEFVSQFDVLAPLVLILLVVLQVLIAPIPGQAAGLASGFIFGPVAGTIYSMIGLVLGSYIAFLLSRKFGRPFIEKIVDKKILQKFDNLSKESTFFTLFLIYLLPALPDDAISYIAGLTNLRIRALVIISALGRLPGFIVLNIVGAGLASSNSTLAITIFIIFMIFSLILFIYKKKLERLMIKIINKIKQKS